MKLQELINELQEILNERGNIEVYLADDGDYLPYNKDWIWIEFGEVEDDPILVL